VGKGFILKSGCWPFGQDQSVESGCPPVYLLTQWFPGSKVLSFLPRVSIPYIWNYSLDKNNPYWFEVKRSKIKCTGQWNSKIGSGLFPSKVIHVIRHIWATHAMKMMPIDFRVKLDIEVAKWFPGSKVEVERSSILDMEVAKKFLRF
jgi:hypothetical protein